VLAINTDNRTNIGVATFFCRALALHVYGALLRGISTALRRADETSWAASRCNIFLFLFNAISNLRLHFGALRCLRAAASSALLPIFSLLRIWSFACSFTHGGGGRGNIYNVRRRSMKRRLVACRRG